MGAPLIVGIGGTTNAGSSTETALRIALDLPRTQQCRVELFGGAELQALPYYSAGAVPQSPVAQRFVAAIREAQGVIIASPGFHGSVSGLVKNALDYIEETARDDRVYLDGLPVGLIVTAFGWQATASTLGALRCTVHALRGWPTPFGACIRAEPGLFVDGRCTDETVAGQLHMVGRQMLDFMNRRHPELAPQSAAQG